MPPINSLVSRDNGRENLKSPTDQPAERRASPPFSRKLTIDGNLKLSQGTFKQTIHDLFKDKNITPLSQLKTTPAFPSPYVLAQFANKAYTDHKPGETDAQYETRLDLSAGWKLLTTASNAGMKNGYFGAAYWNPEHQQVVIAHRGTKLKKWGPVWTDVQGVLRNKYVPQMSSASTFAYKVVEVLREVDHAKGTNFEVFFTGHSLGGWLAQITTFTTEYLKTEGNNFLKRDSVSQSYHPHTVVFDSPGCKDMLSKMANKLDGGIKCRSSYIKNLDITSYLSAPNRVNTCNKHVEMVYRIFIDLSGMDWQEKHTAKYNLATHKIDKIVGAFDPETGQVRKDETGKLKIQKVVEWPTCDLLRGREYDSFFEWSTHLNDYHTDIQDTINLSKSYNPIRYKTENCDERESSKSIFSQEEWRFLKDYRRLCQLPEFFQPKEMFSKIGNNQAEEETKKKLHSFEIENETIRCADASALQALIPYVKRVLQLFPEIKEKTKCALLPHEIRNNVYQIGTKRYLEKLKKSPLDFKADALSLRDFLNSDEQKVLHLRMVDGDAWTGLIKVYQVLQQTPSVADFRREGHYTVLTLEHLLLVNQMVNLNTLMESTRAPHLLIMSCENSQMFNDESKQILGSIFNTLRQKQSVKIILTTQSEGGTASFLEKIANETLSNEFLTRNEKLTLSDLTPISQEKLLENAVKFQGSEIALNQLISADSPVKLSLAELLHKKHLNIGREPAAYSECNFYDEGFYIDRTFHHQVIIKQDILNDRKEKKFPDILASTEQEFTQICQLNSKRNVHWLERDKSGNLVWQQSQGNLEKLRKYIDTDSWHTYTPGDLDKLLEQAQHQRVMLISDTAGMGKSTVLTHLSKQIKQKFPAKWVVIIYLNDHTDALEALHGEEIGKEKAIEFVSEKILKLETVLEKELFKQCCEQKQKVDIVIMVDGYDEVSPTYEKTVIDLLQALRQTAVEQLWVTTRPHLREELEDKLQQLSYTLEPFSLENQVEFLSRFWRLKDWFTQEGNNVEEETKNKLEIFAEHVIKKLAQSISDKDKEFTRIPLQCRMLAEAFDEEVKTFYMSADWELELQLRLDLLGLYKRFIHTKYHIYQKEKSRTPKSNVAAFRQGERVLEDIMNAHQLLALKVLFPEEQVTLLPTNGQCTFLEKDLPRIGIVQGSYDGTLHFIHRTFADYCVADFLVNKLTKGSNTFQQVQDLLLQKIFLEADYRVVRAFIDGLLARSEPSREVLKQYGNRIHDLGGVGVSILHKAAREGNAYIVEFLLDSVQAGGHTDTVNMMLLAQDNDRRTAWYLAAECGNLKALKKIWKCAEEKLEEGDLIHKLLLAKGISERKPVCKTAWHLAAEVGNLEVLRKLWEWGAKILVPEQVRNNMLLATTEQGETALHYASLRGDIQVLDKLWKWAKKKLKRKKLNEILLALDTNRQTAWHVAAKKGNLQALEKLWKWSVKILTPEEMKIEFLLATTPKGNTAFRYASLRDNIEVLDKLLEWAKQTLKPEEVRNVLFLDKDGKKQTILNLAADRPETVIFDRMWEWATKALTQEETKKLLLAKDEHEQTVLHVAAKRHNTQVFGRVWEWAERYLYPEETRNDLLLPKNDRKETVWHILADRTDPSVFKKLWDWATTTLAPQQVEQILSDKDDREQSIFEIAEKRLSTEVFEGMLALVENKLPTGAVTNE